MKAAVGALARGITLKDKTSELGALVGSADLRDHAVHRWYFYKEGFSPLLPSAVLAELGAGTTGRVVDCFAGVGTTPISLHASSDVTEVLGIEYSPFATFVARVKANAPALNPARLEAAAADLRDAITRSRRSIKPPSLSSFANPEMFAASDLRLLLRARAAIDDAPDVDRAEREFFRLGLAAIVEDVSGAMKDGRALRLLRGRKRKSNGLTPTAGGYPGDGVLDRLSNQWLAMIEDIRLLDARSTKAPPSILKADARHLSATLDQHLAPSSSKNSVGLYLFSPPYLNCLDYTEVYKLELWLLGFITDQTEFRTLREGTLRSHPSIKFPARSYSSWGSDGVFAHVEDLADLLEARLPRPALGGMVRDYFRDMHEVLIQQVQTLESGGHLACVVANSTFAGRTESSDGHDELWRVPVMTDVIIARLAERAGAIPVAIWDSRRLRPRNARTGTARESVVVCRKP